MNERMPRTPTLTKTDHRTLKSLQRKQRRALRSLDRTEPGTRERLRAVAVLAATESRVVAIRDRGSRRTARTFSILLRRAQPHTVAPADPWHTVTSVISSVTLAWVHFGGFL